MTSYAAPMAFDIQIANKRLLAIKQYAVCPGDTGLNL